MRNKESNIYIVSSSVFHDWKLYTGILLIPAYLVLVFSYNYHALWIMYDLVAIVLLFNNALYKKYIKVTKRGVALAATISYFLILVILNDHLLLGLLSVWDTFKHIIYFQLIASISSFEFNIRNQHLSKILFKLLFVSYLIQIIFVAMQYSRGFHFDNVAGTFGDGGSHAIAYISILMVVATIAMNMKTSLIILLSIISFYLNIASENAGYFVLLLMVIFTVVTMNKLNYKFILVGALLAVMAFLLLDISVYSEKSFSEIIISRIIGLFDLPDYFDPLESHGRNSYFYLATILGGWFGVGPGAFSNIYQMEGYEFANLIGRQININEVTHLISESGFIGLFLTLGTYLLFVSNLFSRIKTKIMASVLFIMCMLYSAILMNESQMFILLLIFYYLRILENQKFYSKITDSHKNTFQEII